MQTVTLKTVVEIAARRAGLHPESGDGLTNAEIVTLVALIEERLRTCWEWAWWPDLMRVEQRAALEDADTSELYVPTDTEAWDNSTAYETGDVVERYGTYYEALDDSTGEDPLTATTYWEATAQTPIGSVLEHGVTTSHPQVSQYPYHWPFVPKNGRITLTDSSTPDALWVHFRTRPPTLNGTAYDKSIAYSVGAVRYYPDTGECYRCVRATPAGTAPTNTDYWEKVDIPAWLARAAALGAAADWRAADEEAAAKLEADALRELMDSVDRQIAAQGQAQRAVYRKE